MAEIFFVLRIGCAAFLAYGTLTISHSLSRMILPGKRLSLRWSATAVIGMFFSTMLFHLLLSLSQFRLPVALVSVAVFVTALRWRGFHFIAMDSLSFGSRQLRRTWLRVRQSKYRFVVYFCTAGFLITCVRAAILPPLGWDTITYHGVKAAMWIQQGTNRLMSAPGGWSIYRSYFGGGELFSAWAMLPFHSDLLVGMVDVTFWILWGVVLYALGAEFGVRVKYRWVGILFLLSMPAVRLSIGSGYVEPSLNVALLAGVLFAARFLRSGDGRFVFLSLMALGVACGIKVPAIPFAAVVIACCLIKIPTTKNRASALRWLGPGLIVVLAPVSPWLVYNLQQTGYPFGSMAFKVAGITLGQPNAAMQWYISGGPSSYNIVAELRALRSATTSLNPLIVIPLLVFPFQWYRFFRSSPVVAMLAAAACAAIVVPILAPGFSVPLLYWSKASGRFLLPAACIAMMVSLRWEKGSEKSGRYYVALLTILTFMNIGFRSLYARGSIVSGWALFEYVAVPVGILSLIALCSALKHVSRINMPRILRTIAIAALVAISLAALDSYRSSVRYKAAGESYVLHYLPAYWTDMAALVDEESPRRVAVTAGPWKKADNWYMYCFLGKRLQNTLVYIPVTASGSVVDFVPGTGELPGADLSSWYNLLRKEHVTEVMSFRPTSIEFTWMKERRDLFEPLQFSPDAGLFRVKY